MFNIKFVRPYPRYAPEKIYLYKQDIVDYLMEIAGSEDTDTRERLEAAARILNSVGINNGFAQEIEK